jgi:hypothetical protein
MASAEIIARRTTYDHITVAIWSDGAVSNRTGSILVRGRVPRDRLFEFADWVSIYRWDELGDVIAKMKRGTPAGGTRIKNPIDHASEHPIAVGLTAVGVATIGYLIYVIAKGSPPAQVVNSQVVPYGA